MCVYASRLRYRYTPESIKARLAETHRTVWNRLDDANVAALFTARAR